MEKEKLPWVEILVDASGKLLGVKASGVNVFVRVSDSAPDEDRGEAEMIAPQPASLAG